LASSPDHEPTTRSYPDHPHSGVTRKNGATRHANKRRKEAPIPIRIARIDTIPMTDEELHRAAEALAVLLNYFWRKHPDRAT
jgi:hypothetical protein